MRRDNIRKILFITLSNIGDVILTLPVLSALKAKFSNAKIDIVVGSRPRCIFIKDPGINRIFIYNKHGSLKEKINFIRQLKSQGYDLAVDMRASLIPLLIGAKNRTGLFSIGKDAVRHKKLVHLNKLKTLGIECKSGTNIYIDNEDRKRIDRLLQENGLRKDDILIGISPVARGPLKQWRIEGFIEVIDNLLRHKDFKVVLIGDATQTDISNQITDTIKYEGLIDLTGKITLNELFALIERTQLLLTCDSASLHIACDLGVRVVAIFGPTDPEEYGPTGKDDIVIRKNLTCSPCRKAICNFNHDCMEQIGAEEVLAAVRTLLER